MGITDYSHMCVNILIGKIIAEKFTIYIVLATYLLVPDTEKS
jgi:hypothetical protein